MRAWTLMTAMPPTKGHMNLLQFTSNITDERSKVIVCTQPDEPYVTERVRAIRDAAWHTNGVDVIHMHREIPQDPSTPGFWPMWDAIMREHGFQEGDYFVSSEAYGRTLAERLNGVFVPFDPNREILPIKGTRVREDPYKHFSDMIPEFQKYIRKTVTIFGAESVGKTTLSKELAEQVNGHWLFEWARPYLETMKPPNYLDSMEMIWRGQRAAQIAIKKQTDKPFIVQDTDLFSTIGYWDFEHISAQIGHAPYGLVKDAQELRSDLYIILLSNIPFEEDPIRYGGKVRESTDQYWIDLCEFYGLNYHVIEADDMFNRYGQARKAMLDLFATHGLWYDRKGF